MLGVNQDDVVQSLKTCKCLGIVIISLDGVDMIQSVPQELNNDHVHVLNLQEISVESIMEKLGFTADRAKISLQQLLNDGIIWIDKQSDPHSYHLFKGSA